jgi:hypothetical protein
METTAAGFRTTFAAKSYVHLNGNSIHDDSYDSSDPVFSTNGRYDPVKAKAGGDIVLKSVQNCEQICLVFPGQKRIVRARLSAACADVH